MANTSRSKEERSCRLFWAWEILWENFGPCLYLWKRTDPDGVCIRSPLSFSAYNAQQLGRFIIHRAVRELEDEIDKLEKRVAKLTARKENLLIRPKRLVEHKEKGK